MINTCLGVSEGRVVKGLAVNPKTSSRLLHNWKDCK
jgi:hypothetical protein